jgi:DNA-3-methyladenine glycosylase
LTCAQNVKGSGVDLDEDFFARDAVSVAAELLGVSLLVDGVGGTIVETEAYRQDDAASHSHRGRTASNAAMFGPPAMAYVYRSYGLHWCLNFVCEPGSAVLIRALEPTHGLERMMERRSMTLVRRLCAGPGNVCQALGVTGGMNTLSVLAPPFSLARPAGPPVVVSGPRIGISRAVEHPWRFAVAGSVYLSKPI